ncbi:MAG: hypothetical protein O3A01_01185 [bacterium]|nr:hypothetical protein [bacterium]
MRTNRFNPRAIVLGACSLAVILVINWITHPENLGYIHVHPHPFWVVILLIALRYGIRESVVLSLCIAGVYSGFILFNNSEPYFFSSITLFNDFKDPFLFILVGAMVGELSETNQLIRRRYKERLRFRHRAFTKLRTKFLATEQALQIISDRISGQFADVLDLFDSVSATKTMSADATEAHMLNVLQRFLHVNSLTLFSVTGTLIVPKVHIRNGQPSVEQLPNFDHDVLIQSVLTSKKESYFDVLDESELTAHQSDVLLAGPIFNSEGHITGIVAVEDINFLHYNPTTFKLFRILLNWWGHLIEERRFLDELYAQYHHEEHIGILHYRYFLRRGKMEFTRATQYHVPLTIAVIEVEHPDRLNNSLFNELTLSISHIFHYFLEEVEMISFYKSMGQFAILYPAVSSDVVETRLQKVIEEIDRYALHPYLDTDVALTLKYAIATTQRQSNSFSELLDEVDTKLIEAKVK